jgi:hypothetical protein
MDCIFQYKAGACQIADPATPQSTLHLVTTLVVPPPDYNLPLVQDIDLHRI